jgi:hypothetical protein
MARGRDSRLARLAADAAHTDSAELLDSCALGARLTVCAIVSDALTQLGIDSARAQALRLGEAAELQRAEAAPHADPPGASKMRHLTEPAPGMNRGARTLAPKRAIPGSSPGRAREQFEEVAASDNDGLAGMFAAKIGDMARRYEDASELDLANSSLAELFAWCLVRPVPVPDTGPA